MEQDVFDSLSAIVRALRAAVQPELLSKELLDELGAEVLLVEKNSQGAIRVQRTEPILRAIRGAYGPSAVPVDINAVCRLGTVLVAPLHSEIPPPVPGSTWEEIRAVDLLAMVYAAESGDWFHLATLESGQGMTFFQHAAMQGIFEALFTQPDRGVDNVAEQLNELPQEHTMDDWKVSEINALLDATDWIKGARMHSVVASRGPVNVLFIRPIEGLSEDDFYSQLANLSEKITRSLKLDGFGCCPAPPELETPTKKIPFANLQDLPHRINAPGRTYTSYKEFLGAWAPIEVDDKDIPLAQAIHQIMESCGMGDRYSLSLLSEDDETDPVLVVEIDLKDVDSSLRQESRFELVDALAAYIHAVDPSACLATKQTRVLEL